jgi:hypothetical protein
MTCSCKTLTNEPCSIHSIQNATNSFESIISSNIGGNIYLKELEAGTDITIVDNGDYLTINSTGSGGGTVSNVSVVLANGISGIVANSTTTPAITLSLGAITPTSIVSSGTISGSNLSGTNTGDQTITLTGDVTGYGTGSFATTIANSAVSSAKIANAAVTSSKIGTNAVTYPKIQNVNPSSLLGNPTGISASPSEITLGTNLSFAGSVLNATSGTSGVTSIIGYDVTPVTVPDNASESNFQNVIIPANTITAVGDVIRFSCAGTSVWAAGASTVWFRSRISGNLDTFELSYAPFSFTPAGSSRYNWSIEGELIVTSIVAGVAKMISNINSKISLNNTAASATSIVVQDTDHDDKLSSIGEQVTADIDLYCSLATNILGNVTATSLYTKVWKE